MASSRRKGPRLLTQKELAEFLPITTRQIRRLVDDGMPTTTLGGRVMYPAAECIRWYIEHREALAAGQADARDARNRKLQADARLAELAVLEAERRVVPMEVLKSTLGTILERLRARIQAAKGSLPVRVVGLDSPREAKVVTDAALEELLEELRTVADEDENGRSVA